MKHYFLTIFNLTVKSWEFDFIINSNFIQLMFSHTKEKYFVTSENKKRPALPTNGLTRFFFHCTIFSSTSYNLNYWCHGKLCCPVSKLTFVTFCTKTMGNHSVGRLVFCEWNRKSSSLRTLEFLSKNIPFGLAFKGDTCSQ